MNINEQERQKKWVIAVSGGSDSMALLAQCIEIHMDVVVAHMNYQKRASAMRDMQGVQAFCDANTIPCVIRMQEKTCKGNFQAFARIERYAFFLEVLHEFDAYGVLVAHQLDDHLETYIMQKKRGMIPSFYGIQRSVEIEKCHVVRPLLDMSKAQLEAYCEQNNVPYYVDESNASNAYTRNRIRHTYIDAMSDKDKQKLNEEIVQANIQLFLVRNSANAFLAIWKYDTHSFVSLADEVACMVLHNWIYSICNIHISQKECDTIRRLIQDKANNWTRHIDSVYDMHMQYGVLSIHAQEKAFSFTYEHICFEETPYFKLVETGSVIQGVTLSKEDFPICIRSPKTGDAIALRLGRKKLNRFFIDNKIPKAERAIWPVMLNRKEEIIFVPEIGCDISHFSNNPNLFVLK